MKKPFKFLCFVLLVAASSAFAQNNAIVGQWQTIDDASGKPKAIVKIYEQDGKIYGKIMRLFLSAGEDPYPVCFKCTDERKKNHRDDYPERVKEKGGRMVRRYNP